MNLDTHIGQYKIVRTLGTGGMGTVYLGEHILLGRRAAIKTLLPTLSSRREIVDRFFNEARAISAISDPGVVQIFDFGYHVDGTAYIVMEFLEGESLSDRIDRLGSMPLVDALRIARQITHSLGAAHDCGIVHRDLKPGNVFVIRDPEAQGGERTKILDFGICKLGDSTDTGITTQTGTMLGTPVYMSPEQCRSAGGVDHRSDIYSVGCALFHMLTGRPPFHCATVGDFIAAHLREAPPVPSTLTPGIPPAVDELVLRCLEKSPDDRFFSMRELHAAIESALAQRSESGNAIAATPIKTPLGDGFKSSYDVNKGNSIPTVDQTPPPNDQWFLDSLQPVPASPITDEWPDARPRVRGLRRFALITALLAGVAGGLIVTTQLVSDDNASAPAPPQVAAIEEPSLTGGTAAYEIAPPVPTDELLTDELLTDEPAELTADEPAKDPVPEMQPEMEPPGPAPAGEIEPPATFTRDAPASAVTKKPARPPRPIVKKRPLPRRPSMQKPEPEPEREDLYDTR